MSGLHTSPQQLHPLCSLCVACCLQASCLICIPGDGLVISQVSLCIGAWDCHMWCTPWHAYVVGVWFAQMYCEHVVCLCVWGTCWIHDLHGIHPQRQDITCLIMWHASCKPLTFRCEVTRCVLNIVCWSGSLCVSHNLAERQHLSMMPNLMCIRIPHNILTLSCSIRICKKTGIHMIFTPPTFTPPTSLLKQLLDC